MVHVCERREDLGTVYIVFVLLGPLYFEDEVVVSIAIESID